VASVRRVRAVARGSSSGSDLAGGFDLGIFGIVRVCADAHTQWWSIKDSHAMRLACSSFGSQLTALFSRRSELLVSITRQKGLQEQRMVVLHIVRHAVSVRDSFIPFASVFCVQSLMQLRKLAVAYMHSGRVGVLKCNTCPVPAVSCFCTSMQPIGMLSAWNCCCNEVASFQDPQVLLILHEFQSTAWQIVKPTGDSTRPFQATSFFDRFCNSL
jgi:hypothetical protein